MESEQALPLPVPQTTSRPVFESRAVFILPAVVAALALSLFPMIFSIAMIFMKLNLISYQFSFNGVKNIVRLVGDTKLLSALLVTIRFLVTALPIELLFGLGLALLLSQSGLRGARFFRVYFVLPMMLSPVAISYDIGQMLFHET